MPDECVETAAIEFKGGNVSPTCRQVLNADGMKIEIVKFKRTKKIIRNKVIAHDGYYEPAMTDPMQFPKKWRLDWSQNCDNCQISAMFLGKNGSPVRLAFRSVKRSGTITGNRPGEFTLSVDGYRWEVRLRDRGPRTHYVYDVAVRHTFRNPFEFPIVIRYSVRGKTYGQYLKPGESVSSAVSSVSEPFESKIDRAAFIREVVPQVRERTNWENADTPYINPKAGNHMYISAALSVSNRAMELAREEAKNYDPRNPRARKDRNCRDFYKCNHAEADRHRELLLISWRDCLLGAGGECKPWLVEGLPKPAP